jgi:thioredoxin reductase
VGRGVFYGAAETEAPAMTGRPVFLVGGGNSAGPAALHLARYAHQVILIVRGPTLASSMSEYMIEQLRNTRNVDIENRAQVVGGAEVDGALAELEIAHLDEGTTVYVPAAGVFVLIGSTPHTDLPRDVPPRPDIYDEPVDNQGGIARSASARHCLPCSRSGRLRSATTSASSTPRPHVSQATPPWSVSATA